MVSVSGSSSIFSLLQTSAMQRTSATTAVKSSDTVATAERATAGDVSTPETSGVQTADAKIEKPQWLVRLEKTLSALEQMKATTRSAAEDQKARAKEKLERIKQQIEMLKRMGFPPEVIAQRAAELARELGAAAQQFVSALSSGGGSALSVHAQSPTMEAGEPSVPAANMAQTTANNAEKEKEEEGKATASFAQSAYAETMELDRGPHGVSKDDRETLEDFRSVARQLKALLEKAIREMREKRTLQDDALVAERANAALDSTLGLLNGVTAGNGIGLALPHTVMI